MKKLAVFFPGLGYHNDKPLLYYSRKLCQEEFSYEVYNVCYSCECGNIRGDEEKIRETFETLYEQADKLLEDISWSEYDEVIFISKSIGTIIASCYAAKHNIDKVRHILYTPLKETFSFEQGNAVAFIGEADPWSDVDAVVDIAESKGVMIKVYEDANHSLETKDVIRNIEILKEVMMLSREYISKAQK